MSDTPYTFETKTIPKDALEQSTYWYDRSGKLHVIEFMSQTHAINAMKKLLDIHKTKAMGTPLFAALSVRAAKR